jgi:GRAM domain
MPTFVDYSCALQRDILVHGRLYVSPGFLCFYANIFGWETSVSEIAHAKESEEN